MTLRVTGPSVPIPSLPSLTGTHSRGGSRFGELVAQMRAPRSVPCSQPSSQSLSVSSHPALGTRASSQVSPEPGALTEAGRQLLARVARGERYVENIVQQAVSGRAFTPADLLAIQAQVYRYTQELELVSKVVERGTSTVKTILQQNG